MSQQTHRKNSATIQTIAVKAIEDAATIAGLIEILEASNSGAINPALNSAGAGSAALQVQLSLIWRLQLIVARAYLKPVKEGDLHLRAGFERLKDPNSSQRNIANGQSNLFNETRGRWLRKCGDHRLTKIVSTRHKFIAHLGEPEKDVEIPTYKELFDFARETASIMEAFATSVGVTGGATLSEETESFKQSAGQFWQPWTK